MRTTTQFFNCCKPLLAAALLVCSATAQGLAQSTDESARLSAVLDPLLQQAVEQDQVPGAVCLVGHNGSVVYRKAFGMRSIEPRREAMTVDTIFDIASLTKPVGTAVAAMQLVEQGKARLNDPVAKYIPAFGRNGKDEITVRQLLTHFSGLREDLDLGTAWEGKDEAYRRANEEKPVSPPGAQFRYSDINFIVLGELIERVSGMPLNGYIETQVFIPLGLEHTRFLPPREWLPKVAPTEFDPQRPTVMLRGIVHDPTARRMGGIAGNAGVFSTADDLAQIARAMLNGNAILSRASIQKMTTPQQPPTSTVLRGLGWDIDSPFSSNRGELLPIGSYGHTGFTGTSLWIDPTTDTYIILLSNAVHPHPRTGRPIVSLRSRVATAVASALSLSVSPEQKQRLGAITGYNEALAGSRKLAARNGQVMTGIDALEADGFRPLYSDGRTRRIGLVTNQTGVDAQGKRTIDILAHAPGIELKVIFSPEHGVTGQLDTTDVANTKDAATGIPVISVYGATDAQKRPRAESLRGLDAIVFDLQDAGARFYTYETTLGYFLEAAGQQGIEMFVLDRPNPVTGAFVQGPLPDGNRENFTAYHRVPVRHGMTIGELARMFNLERKLAARLTVVPMRGWQRGDWFDSTGLQWISPSPNLRSVTAAALYPGVALVEGTNVSVGRGTDHPFEVLGAPWIDDRQLAEYLNARQISGVRFAPVSFTPDAKAYVYPGQICKGVNIIVLDRNTLDAPELGIELASALQKLYPQQYKIDRMDELLLNKSVLQAIVAGQDARRIADDWRDDVDAFQQRRQKYLLY